MKNELTRLELKGRIKSLVETEFSASDLYLEIGNGKIKRTVIKLFNEYGNYIEVNECNAVGESVYKCIYTYDYKGREIKNDTFKFKDRLVEIHMSQYDNNDNKTNSTQFHPDGRVHAIYNYKYDKRGNLIELLTDDMDANIKYKYTYHYDDTGNVIESNYYDSYSAEPKELLEFLINNIELLPIFLNRKTNNKYDGKGNIIESINYNQKGLVISKSTWIIDGKRNTIEYMLFNSEGGIDSKRTYKYNYDETGNWIKRTVFEKDILRDIIVREIEYY